MLPPVVFRLCFPVVLLAVASVTVVSCSKPVKATKAKRYVPAAAATVEDLDLLRKRPIGDPVGDKPWVAHVRIVDLDQDGLQDVISCESKHNKVMWLRQGEDGSFVEQTLAGDMRAPVHVEAEDMDHDGDLDILVSSMSVVFPNNDKIGAIFILENDGEQHFTPHLVIDNIARVVDVRAADFDGDGELDLAVGQFGYDQGEVRWMRRSGPYEFESEILLSLSGTINVCVGDFDGNGTQDFAALVSQQWEEVYVFLNDGMGVFTSKRIWGSTNEDYSCSGMSLCDLNSDGKPDLLFSNGDGFGPNPDPGPKPWHGVQWLENKGRGFFQFHRIGDLGGAYSPIGVDFDGDGDQDVVALSSFNDWEKPKAISMAWYENDGFNQFTRRVLSYTPTHLLTVDAGKLREEDAHVTLVTGGFHAYPPYIEDKMSRILIWKYKEGSP